MGNCMHAQAYRVGYGHGHRQKFIDAMHFYDFTLEP